MRTSFYVAAAGLLLTVVLPVHAIAHCQVPCGIYDDVLRVKAMLEDVTTIEKAMLKIRDLSGKGTKTAADENQLTRWIVTKEEHAQKLQRMVLDYFLAQRVKIKGNNDRKARAAYTDQLVALHSIIVHAMEAKQTVNPDVAQELERYVLEFAELYLSAGDFKRVK